MSLAQLTYKTIFKHKSNFPIKKVLKSIIITFTTLFFFLDTTITSPPIRLVRNMLKKINFPFPNYSNYQPPMKYYIEIDLALHSAPYSVPYSKIR